MTVRQLSDAKVGTSKTELVAQRDHSTAVLRFFRRHRWMRATRHSSCLTVPWTTTCLRARAAVKDHRWLRDVAVERYNRLYGVEAWLRAAFYCIHGGEGSWTANTGNGYHGGLQMDWSFMRTYGPEFVKQWGGAENWPVWAQLKAAIRAHDSGRGFTPWPKTARSCGLL